MSAYTITNFNDIETPNPNPDREAKFARSHIGSEHLGISYFKYGPSFHATGGHSHREQEEVYIVVSGSGRVKLDDEIVGIEKLDAIRVSPGVIRAFEADDSGLQLLAFGPRHKGDGEVIQGWWSD
jgi:mannose-6-phosphate isomerase-like protein (cupin superfamily)